MAEQKRFNHTNGRVCRLDDGEWVVLVNDRHSAVAIIGQLCGMNHPIPDEETVKEVVGDELEGMPTIGETFGKLVGSLRESVRVSIPDVPTMFVHPDRVEVTYGENGQAVEAVTDDARYVLTILPDLITTFLEKNQKYAEVEKGYDLGDKGIVPDLNRKLGIIKARLWDGAPVVGEDTDEVIGDMIGHLLLMLAKRRERDE